MIISFIGRHGRERCLGEGNRRGRRVGRSRSLGASTVPNPIAAEQVPAAESFTAEKAGSGDCSVWEERHAQGCAATAHRTDLVAEARTGVCDYSEQSAEGRSRMGKKGWTMMQMHAQGCAATAQRALRVDRGPRKGHTGFDKSSHRGLGEALQGSGIMLAQQARDEPVISAKGQALGGGHEYGPIGCHTPEGDQALR
ncbi:hypothetical protein V6N13_001816 [Hibiscus sabdariffa]